MATATKPQVNGTTRRTLASQIDRLDSVLDGLSEALEESIATTIEKAVKIAVQQAVENVMTAMLTRPEFMANGKVASKHPVSKSLTERFKQVRRVVGVVWTKVRETCRRSFAWIRRTTLSFCHKVRQDVSRCWTKCREYSPARGDLVLALGVGSVIGIASYLCWPWLAGVAGSFAVAVSTLAMRTFVRLRRLMECVAPKDSCDGARTECGSMPIKLC